MNPFLVAGYKSPMYFCDRDIETQKLIDAALNGRDVTLYSLRKMGKTGLIYNTAHHLQKKHKYIFIFSDILSTENEVQLIEELANNLINQVFSKKNWLKKATEALQSLSPSISFDPLTGAPQISLTSQNQQENFTTLEQIFLLVDRLDKPVYWAFDEFQQIQKYNNPNPILSKLRSLVQRSQNINFVFSGSHRGMLISIFEKANAPFYKSTQLLQLHEIPPIEYKRFITKKITRESVTISEENVDRILNLCLGHTWFVQMLCNRLYSRAVSITEKIINATFASILDEYEMSYYNYRAILTKKQWELIKAVARDEKVEQITSGDFIQKNNLGNSATVLRSLNKLVDDEMIVQIINADESYYRLNDVFLMRWMQRNYS